ncbi:hypothetical protein [Rhizobium leguminosarum]|uniref:hypothetical protein n=1 Tax=Rhizobium leguminosarum TaxID=384 RepID=UPI000319A9FC|nr:hypothetical protein [Rhizobium leguminosarum]
MIAPVYLRTGRIADAKAAYRNAMRFSAPDAHRLGGHAAALMTESGGFVTVETTNILSQILQLDPKNRALFCVALGMEQATYL